MEKKEKEMNVEKLSFKDVETLKKVLDKVNMNGLDETVVSDVLVAVALVADAYNTFEIRVKAINEKLPERLKEYNKNPEKEYDEKEVAIINRYYGAWQETFSKARETILDSKSSVLLDDIKVLSKKQLADWLKANKGEIKIIDSAILYKLMLK